MADHKAQPIDLDAMLEKRQEEVGSVDRFPFTFKGIQWWGMDPILADDPWKDELREISRDEESTPADVAAHYMGEEQWEKFVEAGGSSGLWSQALSQYLDNQRAVDASGDPTQARRSFNRSQRRSKQR
ncbi:hypothetical protein [Rhodococcus sp. 14-2470-1a]|uniref:hypothetical protein n=1 Tax=Rhodococcus sp. 14-2470-1a TaxID=2023150 RepID=UPI000B9C1F07|nr:hypothetical protein [Rhodococcus sp. 14-2470-1a]OZF41918.1 hypothetical protein CH292_27315 [Rhodococcus sp. 14-2470-1a]